MIDTGLLILAFTSGVFSFFTPCSVALIPGYVGFLISNEQETSNKTLTGLKVGLASGLGLLITFMSLGLLISIFGNFIAPYTFWFGTLSGVLLIIIGAFMLSGKNISIVLPHLKERGSGVRGYFLFGVTYALAALGCTLPIFLLVMSQALSSGGIETAIITFLIYSFTTATFMVVVSFLTIFSKDVVSRYLNKAIPMITKLSPMLIIIAGIYLIYFQLRAFYL